MIHRIEVWPQDPARDPHAQGVVAQIKELGIDGVTAVRSARLFFLAGGLDEPSLQRVSRELLADPVTERCFQGSSADNGNVIEVHLKPGVMDPVAASTQQAAVDMGATVSTVTTGRRYELEGHVSEVQRDRIARKLLANPVIEDVHFAAFTPPELTAQPAEMEVQHVAIRELDDARLQKLSEEGDLFLSLTEMQAIQAHYRALGREPSDVELEMIAQTWSEHCVHKTFRSDVAVFDGAGKPIEQITNLIKSTVFRATKELAKPWCLSVFEDNAGVVEFDEKHAVCFKVETHNHPSAIEPYGGASTGIGGVIRDPMGTGAGARPVANTDIFCFGLPDEPADQVPAGVLHPRRVMRGVVAGVRDYGNRMGIPTVNGAVYFDRRYMGNPLVFCGTLGLLPREGATKRWPQAGDAVVVVGGRTGRDGIHGATFSSGELTHVHETQFSHAVQIGNAITEKKMLDVLLAARDAGLYRAITDCGAGGLSSAVGEMASKIGAEVHLERVPLKYAGLRYDEIWISEAQERMVLAVPPERRDELMRHFAAEDVEATVIGHFGVEGNTLRLLYGQQLVGEVDMKFLDEGLPRPTKRAVWDFAPRPTPPPAARKNYTDTLLKILASPNVASKEWIIRQYDHEVQGGSVIKPLVGVNQQGPSDAAVVRPVLDSPKAVVLAVGMNPWLSDLDPYQSALHAVDEALRNVIAVGGDLEKTAILDNFCWGNCNKPDRMGSFVQAAKACYDAAKGYETPFVSGKDSLNNEFATESGENITIPGTLLVSAMSVIADATKCVSADAKKAGNHVFIVGPTGPELGGSHYLAAEGLPTGNDVPPVDVAASRRQMLAVQRAIAAGAVSACHDLSEGGLAVTAAEMAFAGELGMELNLAMLPIARNGFASASPVPTAAMLFGEKAGRFLCEVPPDKYDAFCRAMNEVAFGEIGRITESGRLAIRGLGGNKDVLIDADIHALRGAWQGTFGKAC